MQLDRPGKILVAMHELSPESPKPLRYEDIVVKAFELFPDEFSLRGHPQFPDSSDIHKPLYGPLKRAGFVRNSNKTFSLTERGVEQAKRFLNPATKGEARKADSERERLSRGAEQELVRIKESPAFRLFVEGQQAKILDTDFYAVLGCTVRTGNNDFIGRMNTVESAIAEAKKKLKPTEIEAKAFGALWNFLTKQFSPLITARVPNRS